MTIHHLRKALRHLHRVLDPSVDPSLTDGQLLARFVATRDEAAFAALMQRHGPMVLGVCRRILRHTQDAEDAFQAAFLVLARKAASVVEQRALGSWLYRVAYRIALEAKARNDKRRTHEKQVDELPHPSVPPPETYDWRKWLDHELNLLPERYRAVLVVCDLEECSRKEAARLLDLAEGTISSRLARGRRLLAKRLSRYGLSLLTAAWMTAWSHEASAAVPLALTSATLLAVSGRGVVSASVGFLTKGALKTMFLSKLKWTVGAVMIAAALGATSLAYRSSGPISFGQATAAPADKEDGGKPATELEILRREVELLKLKLEVVEERQRVQEAALVSLRAGSGATTVRPRGTATEREGSATSRATAQERARTKFGILRGAGPQTWPTGLLNTEFKDDRKRLDALLNEVAKCFQSGTDPSNAMLNDLLFNLRRFQDTLDAKVDQLAPNEYIEGKRYLHSLMDTITSLKDSDKTDKLRAEREMWKERGDWSERMSQPGRQFVPPAQAEADRNVLKKIEQQVRWQEAAAALKALREARDPKEKQRAADALEKALKQLREHIGP